MILFCKTFIFLGFMTALIYFWKPIFLIISFGTSKIILFFRGYVLWQSKKSTLSEINDLTQSFQKNRNMLNSTPLSGFWWIKIIKKTCSKNQVQQLFEFSEVHLKWSYLGSFLTFPVSLLNCWNQLVLFHSF